LNEEINLQLSHKYQNKLSASFDLI